MTHRSNAPPLAHRVRPTLAKELVGQPKAWEFLEDFNGLGGLSAVLWGPPGTGKTTIGHIIQRLYPDTFFSISAVTSGVQEIKRVIGLGKKEAFSPILFIDEIHRLNKTQQDVLLPYIEDGSVVLVGATTENPSFSVIPPLLSRMKVIKLMPLGVADIEAILSRAIGIDSILRSMGRVITDRGIGTIARAASGDARAALNLLELIVMKVDRPVIDIEDIKAFIDRPPYHDRAGDAHYELISALHKSIRAGDVDASVYWLGRMLEAGEDRLYILRRMIRMASEDIGNADPNALRLVLAAKQAFDILGSPEGEIAIYQAAIYLACAPKSNSVYITEKRVKDLIKRSGLLPVPMCLRNAPTRLMKDLGYSKGYVYPHDDPLGALDMEYMPDELRGSSVYVPRNAGFERRIKEIVDARRKAKRDRARSYRGSR